MIADLQEAFFIIFGPYITGYVLPVFVGAGALIAILMTVQKYWRPKDTIRAQVISMPRDES